MPAVQTEQHAAPAPAQPAACPGGRSGTAASTFQRHRLQGLRRRRAASLPRPLHRGHWCCGAAAALLAWVPTAREPHHGAGLHAAFKPVNRNRPDRSQRGVDDLARLQGTQERWRRRAAAVRGGASRPQAGASNNAPHLQRVDSTAAGPAVAARPTRGGGAAVAGRRGGRRLQR